MRMTNTWPKDVLNNFEQASRSYNNHAELQRRFALILADYCSKQKIKSGIWADLGAGTGLLADALEACNPSQSVIRVDGSPGMLSQSNSESPSQLWDLNLGLPGWSKAPQLIASNFSLQWLKDPAFRLEEWFNALAPGGWLAVAVPIKGSFTEWQHAAKQSGTTYTGFSLPSKKSLLEVFEKSHIKYESVHSFSQKAPDMFSLLKPIIKIGAHYSSKSTLSVGNWRRIQKAWPRSQQDGTVQLTWLTLVVLIQK